MTDVVMQGRILAQKYELVRLIGQGGMGAVYEARNHLGKRFAVKLLLKPEFAEDPQLATRFFREAKASAAIESEHVVQVYDTGVDPETNFPFIIMELLRGEDLEHTIGRVGALNTVAAARVIGQAAIGLGKAHASGIIHRDIKPANIFMTARDGGDAVVKILDFGIAKHTLDALSSGEGAGLTKTGSMLGTPLYMSPEQAQGAKLIDHRTDVWSLAMCLYESLSGRTPWGDVDTLGGLILAICSKDVTPLQDLAPWVPPELAHVVHQGLARNPDQRIANCAQFVDLLRPFTQGQMGINPDILIGVEEAQRRAVQPRADIGQLSSVGAVTASRPSIPQVAPKKSNAGIFVGIAVFLIVGGAGGLFAYSRIGASTKTDVDPSSTVKPGHGDDDDDDPPKPPASTVAPPPATTAPPAAPVELKGTLAFKFPKGATVKIGKEDLTSKLDKDGKLELTGVEGESYIVSIWQSGQMLLSQKVYMLDDGSLMPPEIDTAKGEVVIKPPPIKNPGGLKPPAGSGVVKPPPNTPTPPVTNIGKPPAPVETKFE